MKLTLCGLILLLLAGCSQPNDNIPDPAIFSGVDPQLQVYFTRFTNDTGVSSANITAGFTSIGSGIAGECVYDGPYHEVRIDVTYWASISDNQKEQLVYHELGHCALYLQHINNCSDGTTAADGTYTSCNNGYGEPLSVMNWLAFSGSQANYYENNKASYINALVNNTTAH